MVCHLPLVCDAPYGRRGSAGIPLPPEADCAARRENANEKHEIISAFDLLTLFPNPAPSDFHRKVTKSRDRGAPAAGFDETYWNDEGCTAYVNVAQSGDCVAISISGSRA